MSAPKFSPLPLVVSIICLVVGIMIGKVLTPAPASDTPSDPAVAKTTPPKTATMSVEAVYPSEQHIAQTLNASGIIVGKEIAHVGAKVNGVAITKILVDVGDYVKAGQVLAILDNSTAHEQTNIASAELERAKAVLDKAKADVARVTPLLEMDAISRQSYDAYVTAEREATATVKSLEARLASSRTTEAYTQILAPVSGIVSEKYAEVGMITAGTPLFHIIKHGVLEWQASLPASQADKIKLGHLAKLDVSGETLTAYVDKFAPIANNSREITVHATLPPSPLLRAGMYQAGQFVLGTKTSQTLPYRAISTSDGMDYVWTLTKSDGDLYQAHRKSVTILAHEQDKVAVELDKDTLVVAGSGNFLSDGSLVKVINGDSLYQQDNQTSNQTDSQTDNQTDSEANRQTNNQNKSQTSDTAGETP